MSLKDNNIFKREIFRKVSVKIFDRFQFTLKDEGLIQTLQRSLFDYFNSKDKNFRFKFEDLLLQEEYEDSFQEFNEVLQESRENSFEEIFELILPDSNFDEQLQKTLKQICSNNYMQEFLKQLNIHFIKTFKSFMQEKSSQNMQQTIQDNLRNIQEQFKTNYSLQFLKFGHNQGDQYLQTSYSKGQFRGQQNSINTQSNKSLSQQDSQIRVFLMDAQDQIQKLNENNILQQKQKLQNNFKEFLKSFQIDQSYCNDIQQVKQSSQFNGFLPFENVYKLEKNENQPKRQSQIFTIEHVHYDQTDDAEDCHSSDYQNSQQSYKHQNTSKSIKNPALLDLVRYCQQIQQTSLNDNSIQQNIMQLIQKTLSTDSWRNTVECFIENQIENIQICQSKQFLNIKSKIFRILNNLKQFQQFAKLTNLQNSKSITNVSQDMYAKYEKLEEENKSLRMVLKTYDDIQLLDKEGEDSFEIKEDKANENNYYSDDYHGYDQGGLEAVQEENSNYESCDSRSNVVINMSKKKKMIRIQKTYEYLQEKQLDLFKDHSSSKKKNVYSTQKSQRSIFDHENILNQLDFEHKRYQKRSISLPRLAPRKVKKSVKKLTAQARLFKLNLKVEKALNKIKMVKKLENKLQVSQNRLINTVKLNLANNKQFADYISEEPYFVDDNAFQNNLEIQMEYTNDHSVRYQNRKSTTKVNTRDSLRANNQRFSTQPSGTFFQLEEQNKHLQKRIQELKESLNNEENKSQQVLETLNDILKDHLEYEDTMPCDLIESLNLIIDRIQQIKVYAIQCQDKSQPQIHNQNILIVLQEQISTCENQQAASMNNLQYLYDCVQDEKMAEIVENQYNINNALMIQIKKISDNFQKMIKENKSNSVVHRDLHIDNMYQGEDQKDSQEDSYDSNIMEKFEQNLNTQYDKTQNQSQPSLLENEDEKTERERPIREDHEIYQKNIIQKKTTSNMGTSKISSDYEVYDMNKEQLINTVEENLSQNLQILNELQKDKNVEIVIDLTKKMLQELKFEQDFSQTKIIPQRQQSISHQEYPKKIIQLENEVFQKEFNFIRQELIFKTKTRNLRINY